MTASHGDDSDKVSRLVQALDDARCAGRWSELPDMVKKLERYAPQRKCLAQTIKAEAEVYCLLSKGSEATDLTGSLTALLPLVHSLAKEQKLLYPEDSFEGIVCAAWIHQSLADLSAAIALIPIDVVGAFEGFSKEIKEKRNWIRVCAIKAVVMRGQFHEKNSNYEEAIRTYSSILPYISSAGGTVAGQLSQWSLRLLGNLCHAYTISSSLDNEEIGKVLGAFRMWASHWYNLPGDSEKLEKWNRDLWFAYYNLVSNINQLGFVCDGRSDEFHPKINFHPELLSEVELKGSKYAQSCELKKVENTYELLISGVRDFPRQGEQNVEVEMLVEAVMKNWHIFSGESWKDEEVGGGGKEAITRGVLGFLYRSAQKLFLSSRILRHLFVVHAALGEFELAMKAFETYVKLMESRHSGCGGGDKDTENGFIWTICEAIQMICKFGSYENVKELEWVCELLEGELGGDKDELDNELGGKFVALTFRSLGIGNAYISRWTNDVASRAGRQSRAVNYLRKSLDSIYNCSDSLESKYHLALVMAEMRDIDGAIKVVKQALVSQKGRCVEAEFKFYSEPEKYASERNLIPFWHLLALLLSSRSEYSAALRFCDAVFEQFRDPVTLFGPFNQDCRSKSSGKYGGKPVVDVMNFFEKESLLQVKMTQVRLVEAMDGPLAAVGQCGELFAMYSRVIGDAHSSMNKLGDGLNNGCDGGSSVVNDGGDTRGWVFGRIKASRKTESSALPYVSTSSRPGTRNSTTAGTITSTTTTITAMLDDGPNVLRKSYRQNSLHRVESVNFHRASSSGVVEGRIVSTGTTSNGPSNRPRSSAGTLSSNRDITAGTVNPAFATLKRESIPNLLLPQIDGNLVNSKGNFGINITDEANGTVPGSSSARRSKLVEPVFCFIQKEFHEDRLNRLEDEMIPFPRFSERIELTRQLSVLIEIWNFVAGLYVRANLVTEANEALNEAKEIIVRLECDTLKEHPRAKSLTTTPWRRGKSVDELWADIWAQRGLIFRQLSRKFESIECFEQALIRFPNHLNASIGLSEILLEIYNAQIPIERTENIPEELPASLIASLALTELGKRLTTSQHSEHSSPSPSPSPSQVHAHRLHRISALDRLFMILSIVTKLGIGWDSSEAWFLLAQTYEATNQTVKAKEIYRWCVELEDSRPLRSWKCLDFVGYLT